MGFLSGDAYELRFVNNYCLLRVQLFSVDHYLSCMDNKYQILVTLWSLVKEIPQPTQYQCQPRQLILLSSFDWATIYAHLLSLQSEELVTIVQADTLQFSITQKGMDEAGSFAKSIPQNLLK